MLGVLDKLDRKSPVVIELSSWHLELLSKSGKAPHIALITNIYRDHMNRYPNMRSYVSAKANIFRDQTRKDFLILNKNNFWTGPLLRLLKRWHIKPRLYYFEEALHYLHDREGNVKRTNFTKEFLEKYGAHNLENFLAAALAANLAGVSWQTIQKSAKKLPLIKFREEVVYQKKNLKIVNDSTATSPDATIVALKRFSREGRIILIAGGTNKNLDFGEWARVVKRFVRPENLFLLNSSATKKMVLVLKKIGYFAGIKLHLFEKLPKLVEAVKKSYLHRLRAFADSHCVILFSPGAASFEKFRNEFDRGEKFNFYCRKILF